MDGTWIEVFRSGRQTDSGGKTHNFTQNELDHVVSSFDPAKHEPPLVIGHPANNMPAYGWVDGLKRTGDTLLARFKQVDPAFAELVKNGRYKKRSISLYPDGSLRHIGFLGAVPPAVKGLKDIKFEEEDFAWYEYEEEASPQNRNKEEFDMTHEEALRENERLKGQIDTLTTEKKTVEKERDDFSEQIKEANKKAEKAENDLKEFQEKAAKEAETRTVKEIEDFVEGLVKDGKVAPADKGKKAEALKAAAKSQEYNFAEDGSDTFGALKSAFEALPVKDELKDFSSSYPTGDDDKSPGVDADKMLSKI